MLQDLYLWYLENMDSIPVQMAHIVVEEVVEVHNRPSSVKPGGRSPDLPRWNQPGFIESLEHGPRFTSGGSKWDNIAKPFIEDMVSFNAKIHFWNPAGGVLRKLSAYMLANEDWDDPGATLERLLDPDGDGLYGN